MFLRCHVKLKTVQVLNTHVEPLSSVLFSCSLFCSEHAAVLKVEGKVDYYFCVKNIYISKKFCPYNKSQRDLMVFWSPLTFNTLTKIVKTFLKLSYFMFYTRKSYN